MQVIKRDGEIKEFDISKIERAIARANKGIDEMTEEDIYSLVAAVASKCTKKSCNISVEEIQDLVEKELMKKKFFRVAKAYILYRDMRTRNRDNKSKLLKDIAKKLNASNIVNQNANVDEASFGGRKGEADNVLMKWYALNNCMSRKSRENHTNNEIYIHDLDSYAVGMHNCLSVPFDHLLANGFNTRQTDIRPASSVNTAFQLVAVIFQLQSLQQFGGVSATHLDWTMVPYVRKSFFKHYKDGLAFLNTEFYYPLPELADEQLVEAGYNSELSIDDPKYKEYSESYNYAMKMTVRELEQAVEGMYHNLNTLQSRSGNQLPFTSINYGTCTLPEGRMVIKALLEGSINGVGRVHRTAIFPCGIFQYMKGVNDKPGTPNYDLFKLALKSTSKRLYPNYMLCDWSVDIKGNDLDRQAKQKYLDSLTSEQMQQLVYWCEKNSKLATNFGFEIVEDTVNMKSVILNNEYVNQNSLASSMGCRTYNGFDINFNVAESLSLAEKGYYQFSGNQKDGRGNICPVTIIMPTLAMEADRDVEKFMKLLDTKISEAKDMLIERFDYICTQSPESAKFMYENGTMLGYKPEEGIRSALKHGTLALGQLGLAETLQLLIGKNQTTEEGMELAKRIESLFRDRCAEFKQKYKLNFGVYYTPAENLCYTAMTKFKEKYGEIPNVSDRDYFTNSIHVPVWGSVNAFEKIDIESQLTGYSSAGCITYIELDSAIQGNLEALESIVTYAMTKDIPYFAINVPNDTCLDCGYTDEFNDCCPKCGSKNIQQLRRVTGYLTGNYKTAFNHGKQMEVKDRVKHI